MRSLIVSAVRESETRVDEVAATSVWREPSAAPTRGAGATRAAAGAKEELSA